MNWDAAGVGVVGWIGIGFAVGFLAGRFSRVMERRTVRPAKPTEPPNVPAPRPSHWGQL